MTKAEQNKYLYRKKISFHKEIYCKINTDVFNSPSSKGFILTVPDIQFLATHTYKIFDNVLLLPHFSSDDYTPIFECQDGWETIDENEYNEVLNQVIESIK